MAKLRPAQRWVGAGGGAILGSVVSGRGDHGKGAVLGAVIGATLGGLVGNQMDKQERELRRQMEGTGVEVKREGDTLRLQAPANITFETNRADVRPQFRAVMDQLAGSINQYPGTVVQIEGHTDSVGAACQLPLQTQTPGKLVQVAGVDPQSACGISPVALALRQGLPDQLALIGIDCGLE